MCVYIYENKLVLIYLCVLILISGISKFFLLLKIKENFNFNYNNNFNKELEI